MHEEKIQLVKEQIAALRKAFAARQIENIFVVSVGGSLATVSL